MDFSFIIIMRIIHSHKMKCVSHIKTTENNPNQRLKRDN